jgi:hypothetical protein
MKANLANISARDLTASLKRQSKLFSAGEWVAGSVLFAPSHPRTLTSAHPRIRTSALFDEFLLDVIARCVTNAPAAFFTSRDISLTSQCAIPEPPRSTPSSSVPSAKLPWRTRDRGSSNRAALTWMRCS